MTESTQRGSSAPGGSPSGGPGGLRETPLRTVHKRLGATMTGFAGWLMPLRYGSETAEHHAVRHAAGLFDLCHMGEITVRGRDAAAALDHALTGRLSTLPVGRARYTMMCAEDGGVLDDLVVYRVGEQEFLVVANAANTPIVCGELRSRAARHDAQVTDETSEHALIAVQGPAAPTVLAAVTDVDLDEVRSYAGRWGAVAGRRAWLARTGYTGEDGFEVFCRPDDAEHVWAALTEAGTPHGLSPAGLAARDTLRLEAGMPLYGNELSRDVTPYEAGLGRVVVFDKPGGFVGDAALAERARTGPRRLLVGLTLASRRVPRRGYTVLVGDRACGVVTSGAHSPTLGVSIAMAYLDVDVATGPPATGLAVDVRGRPEPAEPTALPFYRRRDRR